MKVLNRVLILLTSGLIFTLIVQGIIGRINA